MSHVLVFPASFSGLDSEFLRMVAGRHVNAIDIFS
jgi:hypothetical protein